MSWKGLVLGLSGVLLVGILSGCDGAGMVPLNGESSSEESSSMPSVSCRLCSSDYILSAVGAHDEALKTREITLQHEPGYLSSANEAARFLAVSLTETKMWLVYEPTSVASTSYKPVLVSLFDSGAKLLAAVTITAEITRYSLFGLSEYTSRLANRVHRGVPVRVNEPMVRINVTGSHADWTVMEYSDALVLSAFDGVGPSQFHARLREGYVQLEDEAEHFVTVKDKLSNKELTSRFSSFAIDYALVVDGDEQPIVFDVNTTPEDLTKTFTVQDKFDGEYPALLVPWKIINADEGLTFSQAQGSTEQQTELYVTVDPSFIPERLCFAVAISSYQVNDCRFDFDCQSLCIETQTNIPILKHVALATSVAGQATRIYLDLAHNSLREDYPDPLSTPDHRTAIVDIAGSEIEVELSKDSYTQAFPILLDPLVQGQYVIKTTKNDLSPVKSLTILPAPIFPKSAVLLSEVKNWFFNAETQQLNVLTREGVVASLMWRDGVWVATNCDLPERVVDIEITPNFQLVMTADVIYQYSINEGVCIFDELPESRGHGRASPPPYTRFIYSSLGGNRNLVFSRSVVFENETDEDNLDYFYTRGLTWPDDVIARQAIDWHSLGQFEPFSNGRITEYYASGNRSVSLAYDDFSSDNLKVEVSRHGISNHMILTEDESFPFNTFVSFDYVGDRFVSAHHSVFEYNNDEEKYLEITAIPTPLEGTVLSSSMGANGKAVYRLIWVNGVLELNRYNIDDLMAGIVTIENIELPLPNPLYTLGDSVKIIALPGGNNLLINYGENLLSVGVNGEKE